MSYVQGQDVDLVWPELFPMLEPACDETITPRDLYEMIAGGTALAWIMSDDDGIMAACVTRVLEKGGNVWLDVVALGGRDWDRWGATLHVELERYARESGCAAMTAHVRRGLTKWLRPLGWRERQVHMECPIDG